MNYVGRIIHDGDTESLIRKYLKAGVLTRGAYTGFGSNMFVYFVNFF